MPVYQWELPDDTAPLRESAVLLAGQAFEVTLFTTGQQLIHLLQVAREMNLEPAVCKGIGSSLIASIGPTCTETLREHGFEPDLEPSHPKLGILVKEAADMSGDGLWKRKLKPGKSAWVTAGEYSALSFILPSSVVAGYLIGAWLDRYFGTSYLYFVFLLLGIVSGFIQVYRVVTRNDG
ncbi:MAG: AtpZ/AtpI family protein [Bryobacteraceae bacterium]